MLAWLNCPDGGTTPIPNCLSECRMEQRCLTTPTIKAVTQQREWNGIPSTTQCLNGTMYEFLRITKPYGIAPESMAFALLGTQHHSALENAAKELGLLAEIALTDGDRDIFDLLEPDEEYNYVLTDYKTWGSFKVAKALGVVSIGKKPDPDGGVYKRDGNWGAAGSPKMVNAFDVVPEAAENTETELQLNRYRIMLKDKGLLVGRMQIQVTVRDGGLQVARGRGVEKLMYLIPVRELDEDDVREFFEEKTATLLAALSAGECNQPCNDEENWGGTRCTSYCDVSAYCPMGVLHAGG